MTPEQLIERVKSLGPEWNHAASKLEDAVRSMETAREDCDHGLSAPPRVHRGGESAKEGA